MTSGPHPAGSPLEVLGVATRLGLTSFGGPVSHLGYYRAELVVRRRWLDEATYADLVALCQFLPGPASSEVLIAIGMLRAGLAGGLAAWLGFTLPSAVAPVLFGLSRASRSRMRRQYSEIKQLESTALKVVQEVLTAVRVVKAFGREDREQERFVRSSRAGMRARIKVAFTEGVLSLLINLTTAVGTAGVLYVGIGKVNAGALSLGDLLMVMAYLGLFVLTVVVVLGSLLYFIARRHIAGNV